MVNVFINCRLCIFLGQCNVIIIITFLAITFIDSTDTVWHPYLISQSCLPTSFVSAPPWLVSSVACKQVDTLPLKSQCAHYAQGCFFLHDTALIPLTFSDPHASFCSIFVLIRFSQHISLFHFLHVRQSCRLLVCWLITFGYFEFFFWLPVCKFGCHLYSCCFHMFAFSCRNHEVTVSENNKDAQYR